MTVALVAVLLFGGNRERSRCFLKEYGCIKNRLSKKHFNRRLHTVPQAIWQALFVLPADVHKKSSKSRGTP